jgi:hypothetical protein
MIIRKECLGLKFKKKSPYNAEVFNVTITDEPENFQLYKILDLDVFEKNIPPIAKVETESTEDKPKKKKKDLDGIN